MARLTKFRSIIITNTDTAVRVSGTRLKGYHIINRHNAVVYVKFFDAVTGDTIVGTTVPVLNVAIPADNVLAKHTFPDEGFPFDVACTIAAVTGVGDADATAPGTLPIISLIFD